MQLTPQIKCYTDPSLSALHHALRSSRRRLIIALVVDRVLSSNGDLAVIPANSTKTMAVSRLTRGIVAIEQDIPVDSVAGPSYRSTYTTLIQTHLPKLDSLGVIEYQPDGKRIHPDQNFIAIATAAAITVPIAQLLFDESISEHSLGGPSARQESTGN
jgi:hypothetical protein